MTYWTNIDRRPDRVTPLPRQDGRDGRGPIRRLSPRDFDREPPPRRGRYDVDRDFDESEKPRSALVPLVLLILILGGALAYGLTRPGALDKLLPGFVLTAETPAPASAPSTSPTVQPPMPETAGLAALIRNTIVALHQANVTGNYSVLRETASPRFQEANTPERLSELFADLRNRNLDLGIVAAVNPRLHREPIIDKAGMLYLSGDFAAASGEVSFELVLEMIGSRWRLFGIGVKPTGKNEARLAAAGTSTLPEPAGLLALIRNQIIALNQANLTGNYSVLRGLAAPGFQEANSFDKLSSIFAVLRERQIDLGPVAVIDPKLTRPAALDQNGMLRLSGFFPSEPERVNFDLAFQNVAGIWRLFGIGLNTSRDVATGPAPVSPAPEPAGSGGGGADVLSNPTLAPALPPLPRLRPQS
jgi:hypothetical protein